MGDVRAYGATAADVDAIPGTTIRFFLSSTFADFQVERDVLQRRVFPELRRQCAASGFRLQPIDLRWGVSEAAGTERQTLRICFNELSRCRALSPDLFLLIQLGTRYGSCILPPEVPADLVARLLAQCSADARHRFEAVYRLDENSLSPQYVLLRAEAPERNEDELLRQILVAAGRAAGLSASERLLFEGSATHREIELGLLSAPSGAGKQEGVLCVVRSFRGQPLGSAVQRFVEPDGEQAAQVQRLTQAVVERLGEEDLLRYEIDWPDESGPAFHEEELVDHYMGLLQPKIEAVIATRTVARAAAAAQGHDATYSANARFEAQRGAHVEGREPELARLAAYLAGTSGVGLPLVVTGRAGSGKSTLLVEAVKRATVALPGAVVVARYIGITPGTASYAELLVDLRRVLSLAYGLEAPVPLTDTNELRAAVSAQLAIALVPPARPLVLIVDALDQLSDHAQRTDWLPLRLASGVRVIVSVRDDRPELTALRARLPAEQVLNLGPLALAAGQAMLRDLLDAAPRRTLTTAQEQAVLAAFAVEGLPLYLQLAASEARRWRSFDLPTMGQAPLPETTPDLLAAILARLETPEQHGQELVAEALGDLAAARFGLAEDELLDLLARNAAVRTSLHELSPSSPPLDEHLPLPMALWARLAAEVEPLLTEREAEDGTRLYTFYHRQLRTVVQTRYATGAAGAARHQALARYFTEQPWHLGPRQWNWRKAQELLPQQESTADRSGAEQTLSGLIDVLEQEEIGQTDPEGIAEIINVLSDRLTAGGFWRLGLRLFSIQLVAERARGNRPGEGSTLTKLGVQAYMLGRLDEARGYYEQSLAIAREVGDQVNEAGVLQHLGDLDYDLGRMSEARSYYEQALEVARDVEDRAAEAVTLQNLGLLAERQGRIDDARRFYQQAVVILHEVGDRANEGRALSSEGYLAATWGQVDEARGYYEQSLAIAREVGDRAGEVVTLQHLGLLALDLSRMDEAQDYLEQALAIAREIGLRMREGRIFLGLGMLAYKHGQLREARGYYEQALAIAREVGERVNEGGALNNLGKLAIDTGQLDEAQLYLEQALAIARELGDRSGEIVCFVNLSTLAADLGHLDEAQDYLEQALVIHREVGDRAREGSALNNLGVLAYKQGRLDEAQDYLEQALAIARELGKRPDEGHILSNLALLAFETSTALLTDPLSRRMVNDPSVLVFVREQQLDEAQHYYEQALAIARELGEQDNEAAILVSLGELAVTRGRLDEAQHYYEQALAIFESIRSVDQVTAMREALATLSPPRI